MLGCSLILLDVEGHHANSLCLLLLRSVITLEDVLEMLLQEQIYDESDKLEREATRIARWAATKWKRFVKKRKRERSEQQGAEGDVSMGTVVVQAMAKHDEETGEHTALLGGKEKRKSGGGLFGLFGKK